MYHSDDKLGRYFDLAEGYFNLAEVARQQNKLSFAVLGFRKTIADGTKKIVLRGRACSKTLKDYFVCNSHKAILNPHQHKRNAVSPKAFCTPCFFSKKRAVLRLYSKKRVVVILV